MTLREKGGQLSIRSADVNFNMAYTAVIIIEL